ncbi:MAG: 5-(carboxyamino)imidazole ribonucleotide mutase [Planctomycetota bacterium]
MPVRKVAVVMGSESDLETMQVCIDTLKQFDVAYEVQVLSAHRAPEALHDFVATAESQGIVVFIAAAGKAAHLAGVIAAQTMLPVIGVPMETKLAGGLDSLLSIVQMPRGIPVGTMGTGQSGALNAAILAAQILSLSDEALRNRLRIFKNEMAEKVVQTSESVRRRLRLA